tara:strand:- start:412 stop:567 length:156 start_codon:yes stop_codon:yes gene_type:complete
MQWWQPKTFTKIKLFKFEQFRKPVDVTGFLLLSISLNLYEKNNNLLLKTPW